MQVLEQKLDSIGLQNIKQDLHPEHLVNDQLEALAYDQKWEFPRHRLKLGI